MSKPIVEGKDPVEHKDPLPGAPSVNRRGDVRKVVSIRATVTVPGKAVVSGQTLDLGRGGASITVPFAMTSEQDCVIDLELSANGSTRAFHIPAQVRYCVRMGAARYRAGVRFGDMDDDAAALLTAVLPGLQGFT